MHVSLPVGHPLQARRAAESLSDTASAAARVLGLLGEAAATRLLECTRRLALSSPQAQLLRVVGGGSDDAAGGSLPHNSSRRRLLVGTVGGGSGSKFGTAGRVTGGTPKQTDRPLLLLQDASARGDRGDVEGSGGMEGSRSASPYGMGAAFSGGGLLRGHTSGLRPAAGGSRFLTDPAGWMTSDAGAAVDDDDAATLLLSQRQPSRGPHGSRGDASLLSPRRQQQMSRGPHGSRGDASLLSPRRQQQMSRSPHGSRGDTSLLSPRQQQMSRGPRSSRGDASLLSPRRQQPLSATRSLHSLRREDVAAEIDAAAGIGADSRLGELRKKVRCAISVEWCYKSGRKKVRRHPGEGKHWQRGTRVLGSRGFGLAR